MLKRTTLLISAAAAFVVVTSLNAGSSHAEDTTADDCIEKPETTAPQGKHWYYRLDRAQNRKCWFLAPERRAKVRQTRVRHAPSSPAPLPPPQPLWQQAAAISAPPKAHGNENAGDFAMRWPELPPSTMIALGRVSKPIANSYGEEQTTDSEDEMPLVWPILAADDIGADEPNKPAAKSDGRLEFVAGAFAIFVMLAGMTGCVMVNIPSAQLARRRESRDRSDLKGSRFHEPVSPERLIARAREARRADNFAPVTKPTPPWLRDHQAAGIAQPGRSWPPLDARRSPKIAS